jgi:predicted RNA-binding protein with TRAM domain
MIQINGVYEVTIVAISRERDGIAKLEDKTIFVPNTKVGDKVKIHIDRVLTKFAMGHKV